MVMSQDPLAKRKSIPNQPMTVLLELTPKEPDMEDSFSSKM